MSKSLTMKPVYFFLGWLFFSMGLVGVFLPVLLTTPFMLLALWSFSKSSEKFHHWLYHHPVFGPPLRLWEEHSVIPLYAKIIVITFMLISISVMVIYSPLEHWLQVMIAVLMLAAAIYVLGKPSRPPE